jgi:hypothetical protein
MMAFSMDDWLLYTAPEGLRYCDGLYSEIRTILPLKWEKVAEFGGARFSFTTWHRDGV